MGTHAFIARVRDAASILTVLARYYGFVALPVRRRLRQLRQRALLIPDPALRAIALGKLEAEQLNAEAASTYATLAPARSRARLARLLVTFQAMYDYLDAVSELPCADPVAGGLRLHRALVDAIAVPVSGEDYYGASPFGGDGGYLADLTRDCRRMWGRLPAVEAVEPVLIAACRRCGEGQARTHAAAGAGVAQLAAWGRSLRTEETTRYAWWELAAGSASSLAIHSLIAAAALPSTTVEEATRLDRAYFPSTCALSTLLDSLVDLDEDRAAGEHSYVAYYASLDRAADGLAAIARDGQAAAQGLREARVHRVIAAGVVGFYVAAASGTSARPGRHVAEALEPGLMRPLLLAVSMRRAVSRLRSE